jgi:Flp pilus assembly pilin Flp
MISLLVSCLENNEAQDLIEYTLLMAFVIVTMAGLILGIGDSVKTITSISNSQLNAADGMLH